MSVGILRAFPYYNVEILDSFFVLLDHLESLGTLVDVT